MKDESKILEMIEAHVSALPRIERLLSRIVRGVAVAAPTHAGVLSRRDRPLPRKKTAAIFPGEYLPKPQKVAVVPAVENSPDPKPRARATKDPERPPIVAPAVTAVEPLSKKPLSKPPIQSATKPAEKPLPDQPGPDRSKSVARQQEMRQRREDRKRDGILAKIVGGAMAKAGKGFDIARGLLDRKGDVGEAAGLAAGGPFWSAVKEFADAVDMTRDNRFANATMGFLAKRFKKEPPKKEETGGRRDSKGRFIKGAKEPKSKRDESVEAIVDIKDTLEDNEKREVKRHKKLLKEIDEVDVDSASGGGIVGGVLEGAGLLSILKGGGIGAVLGALGAKALGKIPGGKFLAKGAGKLAGKLGLGAAGAAGGGILAKGAGVVSKGVGAVAKGAGGLLGKIPGVGALAKGIGGLWGKAGGALAKAGGKSALKKIPVVGAMIGGGFAAKRLFGGDVTGAAGELASGLASIVPGLGTATSVAIDAGLAARDALKADGKSLGESMAAVAGETLTEAEKEAARILERRDGAIRPARKKKWYNPLTWFGGDEKRDEGAETVEATPARGDLGRVSEKYESGGRGVETISSGRGDAGGVSYGKHQLASKTGTMGAFLKSPEAAAYADHFQGLKPGSKKFDRAYMTVAKNDPEGFAKAQHAFIKRTHFDPVANYAKTKGMDVENPAIQEALWSQAVQHSGAGNIKIIDAAVARAGKGAGAEDTINALYDARTNYASQYASAAATTDRYSRERKDVLAIASPEIVAARDKEIKKSLQPAASRDKVVPAARSVAARSRMPAVKPVEAPTVKAPKPARPEAAHPPPANQRIGRDKGGRGDRSQQIPSEFDDALLALISADRI